MAWKQLKDANWRVGYLGGWCEGYVSMAWGFSKFTYDRIGNVIGTQGNGKGKTNYPSATAHWKANLGNHPNEEPPLGITVPVFFSLGNVPEGHVAIRLDDGTVASSTQAGFNSKGYLHPNLKHLIDTYAPYNGGCKYLGWSEYVAGVRIVENTAQGGGSDMTKEQAFQEAYITLATKWASSSEVADWKKSGLSSYEWVQKNAKTGYKVERDAARSELKQVKSDFTAYQVRAEAEMSQLSKDVISYKVDKEAAERQIEQLNAKLSDQSNQYSKDIEAKNSRIKSLENESRLQQEYWSEYQSQSEAEIKNLKKHLETAQQNTKDVSRWTWQEHLMYAIKKLFNKEG